MIAPRPFAVLAALLAAVSVWIPGASAAGTEPELISEHRDWAVYRYQRGGRPGCYLATHPINRRGHKEAARESWILVDLDATTNPGYTVSFNLDRQLAPDARVGITVGTRRFELVADGETAWTPDAKTDLRVVVAMKRGRRMLVSARARDGTQFLDTFSLMGFTSALNAADDC